MRPPNNAAAALDLVASQVLTVYHLDGKRAAMGGSDARAA